jgi:integrase/recombinase XerD
MRQYMEAHLPLSNFKKENHAVDLIQLFEEYLKECTYCTKLSPETIRGYTAVFILFLRVMPEVTSIQFLTREMLVEFFKRIETRQRIVGRNTIKIGVKRSTIKTQWSKLNAFFAWLEKKNYILTNPLANIKPPYPIYDDPKALTDSEILKIYTAATLRSCNSLMLRRDTMMISLLLYCGLRKSELISLRVNDIDLEKREVNIRSETSKSKTTRILKLHPTLVLHIRDYLKERNSRGLKNENLIITNRADKGLTREGLKHWIKSLRGKSGVIFHLHRFRHTFACKLADADVHPFKIQKMMGHTSIVMTLKYVRSMKTEYMQDDINKINL